MEDLTRLREAIDNGHFKTSLEQMRNRCWLCHWSLFVFFNHQEHQPHGGGILGLCDMFFQERYMQAIQYEAPHLLRYCACAVIMSKRRRGMIKDISRIMQVEPYRDPMLEFFDQLFVKFDFDAAQKALENCEAMMRNDFSFRNSTTSSTNTRECTSSKRTAEFKKQSKSKNWPRS